jgi:hypothetical protein
MEPTQQTQDSDSFPYMKSRMPSSTIVMMRLPRGVPLTALVFPVHGRRRRMRRGRQGHRLQRRSGGDEKHTHTSEGKGCLSSNRSVAFSAGWQYFCSDQGKNEVSGCSIQ